MRAISATKAALNRAADARAAVTELAEQSNEQRQLLVELADSVKTRRTIAPGSIWDGTGASVVLTMVITPEQLRRFEDAAETLVGPQ